MTWGEAVSVRRQLPLDALLTNEGSPAAAAGKVTGISVFDLGQDAHRASTAAGHIGKLWGLGEVQIGDAIGTSGTTSERHLFAPPTLETVVLPNRRADKGALHVVHTQLAEQDPLINLWQDDTRQELYLSLYGEVQKEVIQATLADDFNIDVEFRETTTVCIERPIGAGAAVEFLKKGSNPFLATVWLRIAPETVHQALKQGIYGWQLTDCTVTITHSGYAPRQSHAHATFDKSMSSTARDFRNLTPLVLVNALKHADTAVCEPLHRFHLEIPADAFGSVLATLARLQAVPRTPAQRGASSVLEGEFPAARVHALQHQLPALTRGEGVLECAFARFEPVGGENPTRPRSDRNPLNRKEYLLHVMGRSRAKEDAHVH